jgi:arylsulfatase A-like enzyme
MPRAHTRVRRALAAAAVAFLGLGCARSLDSAPAPAAVVSAESATTPRAASVTDHVIVISVDGLRPDAIERFGARTLTRLMREGSFSLAASTILPSKTLPSHTSMLTGTEPELHGVYWNSEEMDEHGHVATPTIFATAHAAGLTTAAFFGKAKFRHLAVPGTLDYAHFPRALGGLEVATRTVGAVRSYLGRRRPHLLFVHLADPDIAGHAFGWMSRPYGWAVSSVDHQIGRLLESADRAFGRGNYTVIVTADHGGHDKDHGSDDPRDVTIPWIAWGEGVAPARRLPDGIRTLDTAATALSLLGLSADDGVSGTVVAEAFPGLNPRTVATEAGG